MRLLAVYPQEPELAVFEKMPPLGMLWVAGALLADGHEVDFLDQQVDSRDPAEVAGGLRPPLALIGGTSHSRFLSFDLARRIKAASPETLVVYGGPHASFTAEDTLTHIPEIDIIVHGEGEETCRELAAWAAARESGGPRTPAEVRGISFRRTFGETGLPLADTAGPGEMGASGVPGGIVRTAARPPIGDLDALGPPARQLVPLAGYAMRMDYRDLSATSIMTARGCPIACSFCSASAMFGKSYRRRSPRLVVDEIEALIAAHGFQGIKIFDSTFTFSRRHVEDFCNELLRRGLRIAWECEIRVDTVDKPLLALMQQAGCYYVDVGVESASQRVLDSCIGKRITIAGAEQLLRWTRELGLLTKAFFTLGHPGETYAEAGETNRFIRRNRRNIRLIAYHAGIRIYPGTRVETFALENGLMPPGFRWSAPFQNDVNRLLFRPVDSIPVLLQPQMGVRELRRLRMSFIAMRVSSPRFVLEKMRAILRAGTLGNYFRILRRGARRRDGRRGEVPGGGAAGHA